MIEVYVEWYDSQSSNVWTEKKDIHYKHIPAVTKGYRVKETDKYIVVSHSYDKETNSWCGYLLIPKCSIIKIEKKVSR